MKALDSPETSLLRRWQARLALAATNRHKGSETSSPEPAEDPLRKFPISYPVFASSFALGRDQAPVSRQAWTKGAADKRVVIEIPKAVCCVAAVVERIIGLAVPVEVGRSDQSIAACNESAHMRRRLNVGPDKYQIAVWRVLELKSR